MPNSLDLAQTRLSARSDPGTNCLQNILADNFISFKCDPFTIVLYCIVLYCIVLYCIVLYCIVLYCIVLYCIVLHYTVKLIYYS